MVDNKLADLEAAVVEGLVYFVVEDVVPFVEGAAVGSFVGGSYVGGDAVGAIEGDEVITH